MPIVAETPSFTRLWSDCWTDDERGELGARIGRRPLAGDVVPGAGGVRKIRWSRAGSGKQGGLRVIDYNRLADEHMQTRKPHSVKAPATEHETIPKPLFESRCDVCRVRQIIDRISHQVPAMRS
jgi:hypothetical protein